jgi:hypothetical protein
MGQRGGMTEKLWYLATPYSKFSGGIEAAFQAAAKAAATLLRRGAAVYSPIAHTHPLAIYGQVDPYDHDIWMPLDHHMMSRSDGMIIVMMHGWEESKGISIEIETFRGMGKPIRYFTWPEMEEVICGPET